MPLLWCGPTFVTWTSGSCSISMVGTGAGGVGLKGKSSPMSSDMMEMVVPDVLMWRSSVNPQERRIFLFGQKMNERRGGSTKEILRSA
jgi:hypothetical protein